MEVQFKERSGWQKDVPIEEIYEYLGPRIVDYAQYLVPVDTGELQDSIDYDIAGTGLSQLLLISASAGHAVYVELGTYRTPAQPYLRPAAFRRWL